MAISSSSSSSPSPFQQPAPAAIRRGRRRRLLSSSSAAPTSNSGLSAYSSSSFSSSPASSSSGISFSTAPSPFHHLFFLSPMRASAVPFSWERRPGIPKTPARQSQTVRAAKAPSPLRLPLPPSLRSSKAGTDDDYFIAPSPRSSCRRRRRARQPALAASLTDWFAVLSFYLSCTRSLDCLAAAPARSGERRLME
ncbi:hypothetical protein ACP70R_011836 [Stipagrostis hirtigluma subsp. patula]